MKLNNLSKDTQGLKPNSIRLQTQFLNNCVIYDIVLVFKSRYNFTEKNIQDKTQKKIETK